MPLRTPAELNDIPGGKPDGAAQINGGVPPGIGPGGFSALPGVVTPVNVTGVYARPAVPAGRFIGGIATGRLFSRYEIKLATWVGVQMTGIGLIAALSCIFVTRGTHPHWVSPVWFP